MTNNSNNHKNAFTLENLPVEVEALNRAERARVKQLPNIYKAFQRYHSGEKDIFSQYFYEYHRIKGMYVITYIRFWDYEVNNMLKNQSDKYSTSNPVVFSEKINGSSKFEFIPQMQHIESQEIILYFYEYLKDKILTKPVDFFKNVSGMKRYICKGFTCYLVDIYNELIGKKKYVENGEVNHFYTKPMIGYIRDINTNKTDADGNKLSFGDLAADPNSDIDNILFGGNRWHETVQGKFIKNEYRHILTRLQLEKFDKLVEYIELLSIDYDNELPDLFQFHKTKNRLTDNVFNKATVARVILPEHRDISNSVKDVDQFINGCRSRMDKALKQKGLDGVVFQEPLPNQSRENKCSKVIKYQMTPEELNKFNNRYNNKYIHNYHVLTVIDSEEGEGQ